MKYILRVIGILLMVEGVLILSCLIPALHFGDGTWSAVTASGLFTFNVGLFLYVTFHRFRTIDDRRMAFLLVVMIWVVLALFGMLPFLTTGTVRSFTDALFESMSGFTSTGATILPAVEHLPSSVLLWRSMTQWFGGFGIVLLVLAIVPTLGINKYSLYTAEASGADNTGKQATSMASTLRQTLGVYILLTGAFVFILWKSGMHVWDAVNITFTGIATGGFSIYNDSLESLTALQQYVIALAMLLGGINFALLYNFLTFHWERLHHKMEQLFFYLAITGLAILFVTFSLRWQMDYSWSESIRCGVVQTISLVTTTGFLSTDTSLWWMPIIFLGILLTLCGGMAGSTTGGLKAMRVLILVRNVRKILRDRLHPHAVNPVRLNGTPVAAHITSNVMVIFLVYLAVVIVGVLLLMLSGINATESFGATIACITSYGPGLGTTGGFGCYAAFTPAAKWICSLLMLMGRLECMTVLVLLVPSFWRRA